MLALLAAPALSPATPRIESDTERATAGYYQLRWTAATTDVEVAATDPASGATTIIYTGPDRARVVSGQRDGTRVYRVREIGDAATTGWSEPVSVTVAHHPPGRALGFFALGGAVFLATLALIIRGVRSDA